MTHIVCVDAVLFLQSLIKSLVDGFDLVGESTEVSCNVL